MRIEKAASAAERPKQEVPADLVNRLLALVRGQFCGSMTGEEWGKSSHFVKRNIILWPAHFICRKKGFRLPHERYEAIMRKVFMEIKRECAQDEIQYWPAYLMKCMQKHWNHHWTEYYEEAKSARNIAETALMHLGRLPPPEDSTIETLASAHSVLTANAKRKKTPAPKEPRLPGF